VRVRAAACAAAVLCGLLTGCSAPHTAVGAHPATHSAKPVAASFTTACALALEADATTALGADPGPGVETVGQHGASSCSYGQYRRC